MIILSARKFRDNQNEILRKALTEEVILTTLHYGNFRLVPIEESGNTVAPEPVRKSAPRAVSEPETRKVSPVETLPEQRSSWTPEPGPVAHVNLGSEDTFDPSQVVEMPENSGISETYDSAEKPARKGEVYVDPSLLTLEEFYEREGIDIGNKKKGIFGKMFGKK